MNTRVARQPAGSDWLITHDRSEQIAYPPVSSMLELLVAITHSDAARLYWMDPAAYELRLVSASSTLEDCRIPRVSLQFNAKTKQWLGDLPAAAVLSTGDPKLSCFPETVVSEIASLLVLPLRAEQKLAGILTLSRKGVRVYGAAEGEAAVKLADGLVASMKDLERRREVELLQEKLRSARQENNLLEKRLAERKLVERAKGLLQIHYSWTEEEAYYHLRRTSRQQRTPMAVIAQRMLDVIAAKELESERLSA
jgi:ANTAR domain